jgi:hypothetical protein
MGKRDWMYESNFRDFGSYARLPLSLMQQPHIRLKPFQQSSFVPYRG